MTFTHYLNIRQSIFYKLFLCCLITVAVMYAYELLPAKKMLVVPAGDIPHHIYTHDNVVGEPLVHWIDFDNFAWECSIGNDGISHLCGFNLYLGGGLGTHGVDLTSYKTINVDVNYTGDDKRLRFYLRNYEPGFSDINNMQSTKFLNVHVPITHVNDNLILSLSEFSIAEWWITQYKVPREHSLPDFRHVIAFGIETGYPASPGTHSFKLNRLELVGEWVRREDWYLGILIFWLSSVLIVGGVHLVRLTQAMHRAQQHREYLATENSLLARETDKYKKLSMIDPLTGLLNRQGLSEYIERYFSMHTEKRVSLVIIDIDHFKKINDSLGHDGGDEVLSKVAVLIKNHIRKKDQVARWGGEEFVLVLPDTGKDDAFQIAEQIRALVAMTHFDQFPELQVTISSGVGTSDGKVPFTELFQRVDIALYQAKAQGRNRTISASL